MAMVFQSYALWPHMTAAQNIGYGLKLRGRSKAEIATRVEEILGMMKLQGLGERMVTQLSGGQRQRVALGRALAINPKILLLDEPLSNLDARIREEVRHEIKELQQSLGITTIHVTHDREEAMVMADRIVILDAGHIAQQGAPEQVYNNPVSPFVAAFLGAGNSDPPDGEIPRRRYPDRARPAQQRGARVARRHRRCRAKWSRISAARRRGWSSRAWRWRRPTSCSKGRSRKSPIPAGSGAMPCASATGNSWSTIRAGWMSAPRSASACRRRACISIAEGAA